MSGFTGSVIYPSTDEITVKAGVDRNRVGWVAFRSDGATLNVQAYDPRALVAALRDAADVLDAALPVSQEAAA